MCACMLSCFSHVWPFVTLFVMLWTVAHQARLSMGLSRQKYWSGFPCLPPGDPPNPGIKNCVSCITGKFLTHLATWEAQGILEPSN